MGFTNPSVQEFKNQFVRDFPYGVDPNNNVLDSDITYGFTMVNANINPGLFADQGTYAMCYNLLAAHYMVLNLRSSSQGINGQYNFLQSGKSAGQISESFSIPERILNNPYLSMLTKTNYGSRYLELLLPQLIAQVFNAYGTTLP